MLSGRLKLLLFPAHFSQKQKLGTFWNLNAKYKHTFGEKKQKYNFVSIFEERQSYFEHGNDKLDPLPQYAIIQQ